MKKNDIFSIISLGYRVFPLTRLSKIPRKDSSGVKDASSDRRRVAKFFETHEPEQCENWGIAGGRIDGNEEKYLIVIDVDTKEGKQGGSELDALIEKYGPVPDTLKVKTSSGGWHFYFHTTVKRNRYAKTVHGTTHIDIKSSGGYVVLPGSFTTVGDYHIVEGDFSHIADLSTWFGEDEEQLILSATKEYERQGIIHTHDGRWSFMTSWAGKLRADGLSGDELYMALIEKRDQHLESASGNGFDDDRFNDFSIHKMAQTFSTYPQTFGATDQGNADRFVATYAQEVRHCHEIGWLYWDGKRWATDPGEKTVTHYCGELMRVIATEESNTGIDDYKKILAKSKKMFSMNSSRKNALAIAKSSPVITADMDSFDSDTLHITTQTGVVDITTKQVHPHNPDSMNTRLAPIEYDPDSTCPLFLQFLDQITLGDKDLQKWLQYYLGYSITGETTEQIFAVFYGTGGNGKSVLMNVITTILGEYSIETPVETIMRKNVPSSNTNDLARIKGARLVTCRESEQGQTLAESLVKSLTGGDKITARFLHKEFFEFKPVAKWILFTNHKPQIRGGDDGIWRRVRLVPFRYRVSEENRDKQLEGKLLEEATGIFNWLLEGAYQWYNNGLPKCSAIDDATKQYKQDEDSLSDFIESVCTMGEGKSAQAKALFDSYKEFCAESGDRAVSKKMFPYILEERGILRERRADATYYTGIAIRHDEKPGVAQHTF